jgi:uncharacterized protein YodC (DUF2158 family)
MTSSRLWLFAIWLTGGVLETATLCNAQITYVDADWTAGNTVIAATGLDPATVDNIAAANNAWSVRHPFGNGGSLLQGRGDAADPSTPELKTTINGLTSGAYDLYVFYWSVGANWSIRAGLTAGALTEYDGAQPPASSLDFASAPLVTESDRTMYAAKVGENVSVSSGSVSLFINDVGSTASSDRTWYDGVGYKVHAQPPHANYVAGDLITFTNTAAAPNGAWSWFEDERVVVDAAAPGGPRILVSSVSAGAGAEAGDVDILWYDVNTAQQGSFELHDTLEVDDHNSAALWIRPDGRYLASYSTHTQSSGLTTTDAQKVRFRVSTSPHDPSAWGNEYAHLADGFRITTYSNLHYLPEDDGGAGRLYNFHRNVGFDPNILVSSDDGNTWTPWGRLFASGGDSDRPYVKYASDGQRIHFITTERHPQSFNASIYSGYIEDGMLFGADGTLLDGDLSSGPPVDVTALTSVFNVNSTPYQGAYSRSWTVDAAIDAAGHPYAVFQARIDPGAVSGGSDPSTHQYFYARYDGGDWQINALARAGADITPGNGGSGYTGLVALHPRDPNTLYLSTDVDPRDGLTTEKYELYRGQTLDSGATWTWSAITEDSSVDNVRPIVPDWDDPRTALLWMRGNYTSYTNWNTEVVGLILSEPPTADFDHDGDVDGDDLAQWQGDFGVNDRSDVDDDGDSDGHDFLAWQRQLSSSLPASAASSVPEPDAMALISLPGCGLALVRRRRR